MHTVFTAAFLVASITGCAAVAQQPAPSSAPQTQPCCGPGYGPGPGPGPGRGPGQGGGMGRGPGVGPEFTPGWGMMSPQERDAHRQQMSNAKTVQECRQIRDEHHKLMTERAKAQGGTMPGPRYDACANVPS